MSEKHDNFIKVKKITKPHYYLVGSSEGIPVAKLDVLMVNRLLEVLNQEVNEVRKYADERISEIKSSILGFIKDKYKIDFNSEQAILHKFDIAAEEKKLEEIKEKMKSLGIDTSMNFNEFESFMDLFARKNV